MAKPTPKSEASRAKVEQRRASGYKGPIDQDGNKVSDINKWIQEQTGRKS